MGTKAKNMVSAADVVAEAKAFVGGIRIPAWTNEGWGDSFRHVRRLDSHPGPRWAHTHYRSLAKASDYELYQAMGDTAEGRCSAREFLTRIHPRAHLKGWARHALIEAKSILNQHTTR